MKQSFLLAIALVMGGFLSAQDYKIKVNVAEFPNDSIYLVNYFGTKLYYADTCVTDKKGTGTFTGKEPLKVGKYSILTKSTKTHLFEILIDEQSFEMSCDTVDRVGNTTFKNSPSNELYYEYVRFIQHKKLEVAEWNTQIEQAGDDTEKVAELAAKIQGVNAIVQDYQKKMLKEHKDNWGAQVVGMTIPIEVPDAPVDKDGKVIDSLFQYNYYIEHFWDNIPLKNPGIVRTPEYDKKLDEYMNRSLIQVPDTLIKYGEKLLEEVKYDEDLFKYTLHYVTFNFERSKIMGHDAGFVHMVNRYYKTGHATWLDSTQLAGVTTKADGLARVLIGNQAPPLYLRARDGVTNVNLYDLKSEYTVVYIWDPDCGHCKQANPAMVDFQKAYNDKGIKVYAVGNPHENEEWFKYLDEHPDFSETLLNVSDAPAYPSMFRTHYDVHTTPVIMLLDKDKKIVAKQITIEQLTDIVDRELEKKSTP